MPTAKRNAALKKVCIFITMKQHGNRGQKGHGELGMEEGGSPLQDPKTLVSYSKISNVGTGGVEPASQVPTDAKLNARQFSNVRSSRARHGAPSRKKIGSPCLAGVQVNSNKFKLILSKVK